MGSSPHLHINHQIFHFRLRSCWQPYCYPVDLTFITINSIHINLFSSYFFACLFHIHTLIYVKCNWFQVCCVILFIDFLMCPTMVYSHSHFKWFLLFFSFFFHSIYRFIISPSLKKLESLICYNSYVLFILSALKIVFFIFLFFPFVCHVCLVSFSDDSLEFSL